MGGFPIINIKKDFPSLASNNLIKDNLIITNLSINLSNLNSLTNQYNKQQINITDIRSSTNFRDFNKLTIIINSIPLNTSYQDSSSFSRGLTITNKTTDNINIFIPFILKYNYGGCSLMAECEVVVSEIMSETFVSCFNERAREILVAGVRFTPSAFKIEVK